MDLAARHQTREPAPASAGFAPPARLEFRRLRRDPDAYEIAQAVAKARRVSVRAMLSAQRGNAETAAARQLAMYLVHVLLGRLQDDVGRLFGRDASTVSHACHVIEDLRDNPPLETEIAAIEMRLADRIEVGDVA